MPIDVPSAGDGLPSLPWATLPEFASRYPALCEWLTASSFSNGASKAPGRISIGLYMGAVVAQLQLPGTGLMLRAQVPDPLVAFEALNGLLLRSPIPFEKDPWQKTDEPGNGKPKGKK